MNLSMGNVELYCGVLFLWSYQKNWCWYLLLIVRCEFSLWY